MEESKQEINIPETIKTKIADCENEARTIREEANKIQNTHIEGKISFRYTHSAPADLLTPFERAQSVCFITRYEYLPIVDTIDIVETQNKFYLGNIAYIRHALNEYRPIIMNVNDSVYYKTIHTFCHKKLDNKDATKGLSISVRHERDEDITDLFNKILGERNKAIKYILDKCEFDYIYNGILQHSDHGYTNRFLANYNTGDINYVFLKHARLLDYIKNCLYWHYRILNQLTFPKLGPL